MPRTVIRIDEKTQRTGGAVPVSCVVCGDYPPGPGAGYERGAGYRRNRTGEPADKVTMPGIARDLDDDAAVPRGACSRGGSVFATALKENGKRAPAKKQALFSLLHRRRGISRHKSRPSSACAYCARYRKVTICARVQGSLGLKVVAVVPLVMPLSAAQATAAA